MVSKKIYILSISMEGMVRTLKQLKKNIYIRYSVVVNNTVPSLFISSFLFNYLSLLTIVRYLRLAARRIELLLRREIGKKQVITPVVLTKIELKTAILDQRLSLIANLVNMELISHYNTGNEEDDFDRYINPLIELDSIGEWMVLK